VPYRSIRDRNLTGGNSSAVTEEIDFTTGVVAAWHLNETSGTRVDSAGSFDLNDINSVLYTTGVLGNAALFEEDDNEQLRVNDPSGDLQPWTGAVAHDRSISIWFRYADRTSQRYLFGGDNTMWGMVLRTNGHFTALYKDSLLNTHTSDWALVLAAGTWHNAVYTIDVSTRETKLFMDGAGPVTDIQTESPEMYGSYFSIGASWGSAYWDDAIDETVIWNRVLNETTAKALWNGGAGIAYPFT
jgi:hypothetical protein